MKRLFLFLSLATAAQAGPTNSIIFNFEDFTSQPSKVRQFTIYPLPPSRTNSAGAIIVLDRISKATGTNGSVTVSNMYGGSYRTELTGPSINTTNYFVFPTTNGVQLNAADWMSSASVASQPILPGVFKAQFVADTSTNKLPASAITNAANVFIMTASGFGTNVTLRETKKVLFENTGGGGSKAGFTAGGATFNGTFDSALYFGHNYGQGGAPINNAFPGFGFNLEEDYNDGSAHYMEWNLNQTLTNGAGGLGPSYRWYNGSFDRADPTNGIAYHNFWVGGGISSFGVYRQQDNHQLLRVLNNGYTYVDSLAFATSQGVIQNSIGGNVLVITGAGAPGGYVYFDATRSGFNFGLLGDTSLWRDSAGSISTDGRLMATNIGVGLTSQSPLSQLQVGNRNTIYDTAGNTAVTTLHGPDSSIAPQTILRLNRPTLGGFGYNSDVDFNLLSYNTDVDFRPYSQLNIALKSLATGAQTADANVLAIRSDGTVGINNTNPGASLDVVGTFRVTSSLTNGTLAGTGRRLVEADTNGTLYAVQSTNITAASNNIIDIGGPNSEYTFPLIGGSGSQRLEVAGGQASFLKFNPSVPRLTVNGTVLSSLFVGDGSGLTNVAAVGLGVASSNNIVDIGNPPTDFTFPLIRGGGIQRLEVGGGTTSLLSWNPNTAKLKVGGGSIVSDMFIGNGSGLTNLSGIGQATNAILMFNGTGTNTTLFETVAVKSTNTATGATLTIAGTNNSGNTASLVFKDALSNETFTIAMQGSAITPALNIYFRSNLIQQISMDGLVGIGLTNPAYAFDIAGGIRSSNLITDAITTRTNNKADTVSISVTASVFHWTNNTVGNVFAFIDSNAATTATVGLNSGTVIFGTKGNFTVPLQVGESFDLTYTGTAPTARWKPW